MAEKTGNVIEIPLEKTIEANMLEYGRLAVEDRAIPDFRDGLKPVHRRLLWAAYTMSPPMTPDRGLRKSAKLVGECFVAGTPVLTPYGMVGIETLRPGSEVMTRKGVRTVTNTFVRKNSKTVTVLFKDKSLRCTPDHKFLALKSGELALKWVKAENLTDDHFLVSVKNAVKHLKESSDTQCALAYLAGHYAANGWTDSWRDLNQIRFCTPWRLAHERVIAYLEFLGIEVQSSTEITSDSLDYDPSLYYVSLGVAASRHLRKMWKVKFEKGKHTAYFKYLPKSVLNGKSALFALAGLIDTDTHVGTDVNRLSFSTVSPRLHEQFSSLLSLLGETGKVWSVSAADKNEAVNESSLVKNHNYDCYWTELHGEAAVNVINSCPCAKSSYKAEGWRNVDVGLSQTVLPLLEASKAGLGPHKQGRYYHVDTGDLIQTSLRYLKTGYIFKPSARLGLQSLFSTNIIEVLEDIGYASVAAKLKKLKKYTFTRVECVIESKPADTYDIEVSGPHEFIANGVVVHNCMGNFHPHGDLAIYGALVSLVNMTTPLLEGQGNFGDVLGAGPAAHRYTECRIHKNAMQYLLHDRYMPVIDTVPNFDSTKTEPVVLPARLPMSLVTGARGIAVGVTTYFPSFTLESVENLTKAIFKRFKEEGRVSPVHLKEPVKHLKFTNWGGGEMISEKLEVQNLFEAGRGRLTWRCAYEIDEKAKNLTITGLPPDWNLGNKTDAFNKIPEVSEVKNATSGGKVRIIVQLRKGTSSTVLESVFKKVEDLLISQHTYALNVTERWREVDEHGLPEAEAKFRCTDMLSLLDDWIKWRLELEVKAAKYEKGQHELALAREETLLAAVLNLDALMAIIKNKKIEDKPSAIANKLGVTLEWAKWLWEQPIRRLDSLNEAPLRKKIDELNKAIKAADTDAKKPLFAVCRDLEV